MNKRTAHDPVIEGLCTLIAKELPDVNIDRVRRAYQFAKQAHEGQFRMSGEPYVKHPVEAAKILVELHVDEDTIITGLLHDVPEDTKFTVTDVRKRFGKHVAELVSALTKLSKVHYKYSMDERQIQSLQKIFLQTATDVRVVIVKLADRLHNMRTLHYLRPEKQQRIAKETMEIYAPLANLFGIFQLRRQLEDLCFMYLQPEEYARIEGFVHDHEKKRAHYIDATIAELKRALKQAKIPADLQGRPKHFYSIYQKMVRDEKVLQDIYDFFAIRVITDTHENCYRALGVIHGVFKPKPGRIKDYLALPKPNGYQSLHSTVVGLRGKLTEVQIRTKEMHDHAEFGAAAHLLYKDDANQNVFLEKSLTVLKRYKDPTQFLQSLQEDILQDRITVFSPSGEVVNLPQGAICLDYMYALKIPVDEKEFRAMVNNKSYSLIGQLQTGDTVEIIFGKKNRKGPERWWLEHVKTSIAKESIQSYFSKKSFKAKVKLGEKLFQKELDHENRGLIYQLPREQLELVVQKFDVESFEQLLAKIGEGSARPNDVYKSMFPGLQAGPLSRFLKWIYRSVNRIGEVDEEPKFRIRILVEAYDRTGLLHDLVKPFYDLSIPILKFWGTGYDIKQSHLSTSYALGLVTSNKYISRDVLDVYVDNHEQLISLFDRLEKIPGVIRVQRVFRRKQILFTVLSGMVALFWVAHPFFVQELQAVDSKQADIWLNIMIYSGLTGLLVMMMWLKSLGDKTFPHFEETKLFWPMAFGMVFLAIFTLFVEDIVFDLQLQLPIMVTYSFLILGFVIFAYLSHERRRTRHLSRLKAAPLSRSGNKSEAKEK